jgi:predicted unusual protein kinase regulating ubiquinone biosynthesis (AarF/ABC1/UbiB family)
MSARTRGLLIGSGLAAIGAAFGSLLAIRDPALRTRMERTARIARLSCRRACHFAVVKVRGTAADEARRAQLEEQFVIRTAEDVANELGHMKGVVMKAGQMLSFIIDGLPDNARSVLESLQAGVPPMAPSLAESVVIEELGRHPEEIFLDWDPVPAAAASIGQVHRAVTRDGRRVAVKVQYPGIDATIGSDLDNAEFLYRMLSTVALKSLDVRGLVDELRERMADELDYRHEAGCQTEFAQRYHDHPFVRVPAVIEEYSTRRVLTSEWVDGLAWEKFLAQASDGARQRAAEIIFRFVQGAIYRIGVFNGDPHPGNYLFEPDGSVTFVDFGLVKRWAPGELDSLTPIIDPLFDQDAEGVVAEMERAGFLHPDHGLEPERVLAYVTAPYVPYLSDTYTFTEDFAPNALRSLLDLDGPYAEVMNALTMPPSFVILDRVVWGMTALMGRLGATNQWRAMLAEYREDAPPVTPLGEAEREWLLRKQVQAPR